MDLINGLFEALGAIFTWRNAWALYREREIRGVYWPATFFFTAWGFWNLAYYPSLGQWASFAGGVALVAGNIVWCVLALRTRRAPNTAAPPRPTVVCLCGSTRFRTAFDAAAQREGLAGRIVLSVACFGHSGDLPPEACEDGHPVKMALDQLHFRKIDMADEILIVNVGGYIGSSTRREIDYARRSGKGIRFLGPRELEAEAA